MMSLVACFAAMSRYQAHATAANLFTLPFTARRIVLSDENPFRRERRNGRETIPASG
jgi:hypothetical protein